MITYEKTNLQITTFNDLKFTLLGYTSSSQRCFLKAYNNNVYYKLSNFDSYLKLLKTNQFMKL